MFFGGLNLVHFFNLKIVIFTYTLKDFLCGEGGGRNGPNSPDFQ